DEADGEGAEEGGGSGLGVSGLKGSRHLASVKVRDTRSIEYSVIQSQLPHQGCFASAVGASCDRGRFGDISVTGPATLEAAVNKGLGAEVIAPSGRDRLAVAPGTVALDVVEFEALVTAGEHEDALDLWRGPLFEGMWIQRAPRFERWLTEEREKLQRLFRRLA